MAVRIEALTEPIPGYRLIDRLGSGGFGEVWKAKAPGGIFKAIKIIHGDMRSKDADLVRYAEQELKSLERVKQVRHPYLLALDRYDIVEGRLMIVMELADCNLWDRFRECRDRGLPGIPRDELMLYMSETAEVLDLFNDQHQLQHLDIKPQNLFLLYNHVKVADFGQVKDLQGFMAEVTGGITPVYAAPETFDGIITRYCDQYSLACMYQELLTGVRPFDGSTLGHLLTQHMNLPPNLGPSPSCDRPGLARALSKKPNDRWPTVIEFVRSLLGAGPVSGRISAPLPRIIPEAMAPTGGSHPKLAGLPPTGGSNPKLPALPTGGSNPRIAALPPLVGPSDTPPPHVVTDTTAPVFTPAPAETFGPGPLRPAIIIGIGQAGLRVLQRLRFDLSKRYGPPEMTPAVRTLYIDTDPDALDDSQRTRTRDRLAGLRADDVFAAKLNRAAHYLKPRFNGRNLTEGWFDPQLLYKIPRAPQTMGMRMFGRLAFCDHYRPLVGKIQSELETALAAESLALTETRTGLEHRTNRPRVYVVASLAGGTGSGMFLDVAYILRTRLKRMGYDNPEVVGVLIVPPADAALTPPQALGNTFAALVELNHYSRPGAVFTANYDDRNGSVRVEAPPFTQCYLLPGNAPPPPSQNSVPSRGHTPASIPVPPSRQRLSGSVAKPGSRVMPALATQRAPEPVTTQTTLKPYAAAADLIRLNLFTPLGRAADEARSQPSEDEPAPRGVTVGAFGLSGFGWPRIEVVARTTAKVTRRVLKRWTAPDVKRAREVMPAVAQEKWLELGLDPDTMLDRLQRAADLAAGGKIDEQITLTTEPLMPRGWLARLPEPSQVGLALDRLVKLFGPTASSLKRPLTVVEQAISQTVTKAGADFAFEIRSLVPTLTDDSQFHLSGTEDLLRQFLATTDRLMDRFLNSASDLDAKAQTGFECVSQYAHSQKGWRKPPAAEFVEALKYPRARFQATLFRALVGVYQTLRDVLATQLAEVASARQRLDVVNVPELAMEPTDSAAASRQLLPTGCHSVSDAVERFLGVITDADFGEIDRRVQDIIDPEPGGVFRACLNSAIGAEGVATTVYEETRAHLEMRLGSVDLAGMFAERYRSPQQAERAIEQTFQEAEPPWVGTGPWAAGEVAVVGCPDGPGGEPLRELARRAIPVAGLSIADTPDELTMYREWPTIPLVVLPHLGPAAAAAYQTMPDALQCPPHARLDVTQWTNLEET